MQSPDEAAAMKAVDAAFKSGVNFFDVAPFYASGDAERVCINLHTSVTTSRVSVRRCFLIVTCSS